MNNNIHEQSFLVFGAGVSGRAAYALLGRLGAKAILVDGDGPVDIQEYDCLILSPGIPRTHRLVQSFLKVNKTVWGEVELASRFIKSPLLAVTGSNGKTTVCMMIHEFLEALGKKSFLAGNIGIPLSEVAIKELDGENFDFVVCEVSSFQLESIERFSPDVAAILNLSFTHQERYSEFAAYIQAKANIAKNANKILICENPTLMGMLNQVQAEKLAWSYPSDYGFSFMKLVGEHNKQNFHHCFQILKTAGLDFEIQDAQRFIESFSGADFRVQRVGSVKNFIFYNDAKSTNLKSTTAAIECFQDKKVIFIGGGKLREEGISPFSVIQNYQFEKIYTMGESGADLATLIQAKYHSRLEDIFKQIKLDIQGCLDRTEPVHVLFSPGFPSFDQYRNYVERGEHFNQLVAELS